MVTPSHSVLSVNGSRVQGRSESQFATAPRGLTYHLSAGHEQSSSQLHLIYQLFQWLELVAGACNHLNLQLENLLFARFAIDWRELTSTTCSRSSQVS